MTNSSHSYVDFNSMLAEEMARQRQALTPALQGGSHAGAPLLDQLAHPGAARVSFAAEARGFESPESGYDDYGRGSVYDPTGRIANNPMEKSLATAFGTLLPAPDSLGYNDDQYGGGGGDSALSGLYNNGNNYGSGSNKWALEPYGGGLGGGGPPLGGSIESLDQFVRSWQHKNPVDSGASQGDDHQRQYQLIGLSNSNNNNTPPRMPVPHGESPRRGGGSARGSMRQRPPSTGEQSLAGDSLLMYLNGTAGAARAASTLPENNGQPAAALLGNVDGGLNAGESINGSSGQAGMSGGQGDDPFQALVALYPTTAATPQRRELNEGNSDGASGDAGVVHDGGSVLLDATSKPAAPAPMNPSHHDQGSLVPQLLVNMSGSGGAMREMFAAYGQPPLTVDLPQQQYHQPYHNDSGGVDSGANFRSQQQDYVASPASAQAPPPRAAPRPPPSTSIPHQGETLNEDEDHEGGDEVVVVPGLQLRGHQGGFQPEKPAPTTMPSGQTETEVATRGDGQQEGNVRGEEGALEVSMESYANTSVSSFNGSV